MPRRPALDKAKSSAVKPAPQRGASSVPNVHADPLGAARMAELGNLVRGQPIDRPVDLPNRGPGTDTARAPVAVAVSVDTLVLRADIGTGVTTFVAAGQFVPRGLEGFQRVPA